MTVGFDEEVGKKKLRRETVNLPSHIRFEEGDQVFLGADAAGNSRLVPWDIHCPEYSQSFEGLKGDGTNGLRHIDGQDDISLGVDVGGDLTVDTEAEMGSKTVFTWRLDDTHTLTVHRNTDANSFGYIGISAWVSGAERTDILEKFPEAPLELLINAAPWFHGMVPAGSDATYWYFVGLVSVYTTTGYPFLLRVHKTTYAITKTSGGAALITGAAIANMHIIRVDEAGEQFWVSSNNTVWLCDYDLTAFTQSVPVTKTVAETIEAWGAPIVVDHFGNDIFIPDPDDLTISYLIRLEQASQNDFYGLRQESGNYRWRVFKLVFDGTVWESSLLTGYLTFNGSNHAQGFCGLGGGYFMNLYETYLTGTKQFYIGGGKVVDIFERAGFLTGVNNIAPTSRFESRTHNLGSNSLISGLLHSNWQSAGVYMDGVYYWGGDAFVGGEVRAGIDIEWLISYVAGEGTQLVGYGASNSTGKTRLYYTPVASDDDFIYLSVLWGSTATDDEYVLASLIRWPKPCQSISRGPIGRAVTDGVVGEYSQVICRATANVANNDTITLGSRTYTYKTTLTGAADEIKIGAAISNTWDNTFGALRATAASEGSTHGTGTLVHADVQCSHKVELDGEWSMVFQSRRRDGVAYASTESSTVLTFDHATFQNGVQSSCDIEFYEGVSDVGVAADAQASYGGERYEMKPVVGTFDMSHCEIKYWEEGQIAVASIASSDMTDIESRSFKGPVIAAEPVLYHTNDTRAVSVFDDTLQMTRGNKIVTMPYSLASYVHSGYYKVGVLK